MGPRAGLDGCGKSRPHRESIPHRPARSSVAIPTELPGLYILYRIKILNLKYYLTLKLRYNLSFMKGILPV